MDDKDIEMTKRLRDIVAVAVQDIDAVIADVEDGVAYLEGVVSSDGERRALTQAAAQIDGISHVVACLSTERVLPAAEGYEPAATPFPAPVMMHYYSLS